MTFGRFINILFPLKCPVCDETRPFGETLVCPECRKKLPVITGPRCFKCGRPVEYEEQEICFECGKKDHVYSRGFAAFLYNEDMRKAMSDYKFNNRRDNGEFFARELAKAGEGFVRSFAPDMLVPVPVHRTRYRTRGYNQAEIIAERVGQMLGVEVCDVLERRRKTLPQKKLGSKEREENLKKAFAVNADAKNAIKAGRILLVDDIYTTGSTVNSCAALLLKEGACEVGFLSACVGKGN